MIIYAQILFILFQSG